MRTCPAEIDLSTSKISEPLDAYRVSENRFAVATYTPEKPHMITYGLYVCKGLVMYNPEGQRGLVSHLSAWGGTKDNLNSILSAYDDDLKKTDVTIVEAVREEDPRWPNLESLCQFFLEHNPRSLKFDQNVSGSLIRGVALNLESGEVNEIDGSKGWTWSDQHDTSLNQPVRLGYSCN